MEWPDGTELTKKQIANFKSTFSLYEILFSAYHKLPPTGVDEEYWRTKVISAFTAQVFFNLPYRNQVLYSGLISTDALKLKKKDRRKEHRYPRKEWSRWRLFNVESPVTFETFFSLYCKEGGTVNHTTKDENTRLESWYDKQPKEIVRDGWRPAYKACGIILIEDPDFTKS